MCVLDIFDFGGMDGLKKEMDRGGVGGRRVSRKKEKERKERKGAWRRRGREGGEYQGIV